MDFFTIPAVSILISVVICWALFSVACSMIHETVVRVKAERGRFMKANILQQLRDDANDINWGLELYRQPPVSLLSRDIRKPTDAIDPGVFASALLSAVAGSNLVQTKLQTLQTQAAAGSAEAGKLLATLTTIQNPTLRQFKAATVLLHPSEQVGLLSSLIADAELKANGGFAAESAVYQHLLGGIQDWYNGLTDRLSLWYKKVTHRRLFWLGLLIAIAINVDSVTLFGYFNANPQARTRIIEAFKRDSARLDALSQGPNAAQPASIDSLRQELAGLQAVADSTGLPVGLSYSILKHSGRPGTWQGWLLKLVGLLISAFAASLGAPFWFDALNKAFSLKPKT